MKKTAQLIVKALILIVLVVCAVYAGGYQLNEQGARAVGMGGAFVARASDPSAVYFNPAGLTSLTGIKALGGFNLILPSTTFKGPYPLTTETSTESQVFTPINLYGSYQIDDQIVVGLGIFNPFGLGIKWPASLYSVTSDLQTWYINPSAGYKINDQISVGLGLSFVYAAAEMSQTGKSAELTGSGFNINIGGIYKPMENLSIGLSYRIQTDIDLSGDITQGSTKMTGETTIPLPGNLQIGSSLPSDARIDRRG